MATILPSDSCPNFLSDIDSGSYGVVSLLRQQNGEVYACKRIPISYKSGIRFPIEIDILKRYSHPNIMYAIDILEYPCPKQYNDCIYELGIIMPLALANLHSYIKLNTVCIQTKLKLLHDICLGLSFLHSHNILHLDLKLENILVFGTTPKDVRMSTSSILNEPRAVITDFGLSLYCVDHKSRFSNKELVTITYRPPEILFSKKSSLKYYTDKVDIWSLGILFIRMLTGITIFPDARKVRLNLKRLFGDKTRNKTISNYLKDIPNKNILIPLISSMLSINPSSRPSISQILSNPIFSQFHTPISGIVYEPTLTPVHCTYYMYFLFNLICGISFNLNIRVETFFLCIDLFHRVLPFVSSFEYSNLLLYMMSCFWIAFKSLEDTTLLSNQVIELFDCHLTPCQLSTIEKYIILSLDGIIYRSNVFTWSHCRCHKLFGFEYLRNPQQYSLITPDILTTYFICTSSSQHSSDNSYVDEQFNTFFPDTAYYKYAISFGDGSFPTSEDHIQHLFNTECI